MSLPSRSLSRSWGARTALCFVMLTGTFLAGLVDSDGWVADGNYSKVRDLVWGSADLLVWLDYALPVIMGRLVSRTLRRLITREVLWNDNRENWRAALFSVGARDARARRRAVACAGGFWRRSLRLRREMAHATRGATRRRGSDLRRRRRGAQ